MSGPRGYFSTRLAHDPRRTVLWQTLWREVFSRFIRPTDTVLELGCGYGDFINAVRAQRRIAVDRWPDFPRFVEPAVEAHVGSVTELSFLAPSSIDVVFASNLLEHLPHDQCAVMLGSLGKVLRPDGQLIVLQPNYRYAYREYFDDYTHVSVYSHVTLCDVLRGYGFEIVECRPRFLPLTIKSRFPVHPWLIKAYLHLPFRPFGKQMLIVARLTVKTSSRGCD